MERRELLRMIAAATGAAFVGNAMAWTQSHPAMKVTGFTGEELEFLGEVAETILPRTDTPGAKDANVGQIMALLVVDCYLPDEQKVFRQGMVSIDQRSASLIGKPFLSLDKQQRESLLSALDDEARQYNLERGVIRKSARPGGMPGDSSPLPHYFTLFKQLALFGFFTSSIGATQALRYVAVPGRYDGEYPYRKGDRAWAT